MKKIIGSMLLVGMFLVGGVFAHQPRLVFLQPAGQTIEVQHPEISQAFYGMLSGQRDTYHITITNTGTLLYVSIAVPDLSGQTTDFTVYIMEGDDAIYTGLEGKNFMRTPFFEPFGGDRYLHGPKREQSVGPGEYTIIVTNEHNQGKYSLIIGKKESFSPPEIVQTYLNMPALKMIFFQKPRYTIYWSYVGAFGGLIVVVSGGIVYFLIRQLRRLKKG